MAPLRSAAAGHPLDFAFRAEVRRAVEYIQERLEGAEEGQLSLTVAEEAGGEVSLSTWEERGRLSLDREEEPPREREVE